MAQQQLDSSSFVVRSKTLKFVFLSGLLVLLTGSIVSTPVATPTIKQVPFTEPVSVSSDSVERQSFYEETFVPTRLDIPSLNIDATIEAVGKDEVGRMDTPSQVDRVGWYQFGAKAGETGNVVLAGHLDDLNGPAIFADLPSIRKGELVTLQADQQSLSYEVTSVEQYRVEDVPLASIFAATQSKRIQLITCAGPYDPERGYRDRVVVTANLIDVS